MPYFIDEHRVDSPTYRPPRERGAELARQPMTVTGLTAAQDTAARPQQPTSDTVVAQAYSGLVNVTKAQQKHNDEVVRDSAHLTQEGLRARLNAFADSAEAKSVDGIEASVDQLVARKQAEVQATLKALSPPGDTAEELRRQRVLDRTLRKLDKAKDVGSVTQAAREMLEQATPDELPVLVQEVPHYLEDAGAPADWVQRIVATKAPQLAEAQTKLAAAQQAQVMTRQAAKFVRDGIRDGSPPTQLHLLDPSRFDPDRDGA
jgi:hypothetical protein